MRAALLCVVFSAAAAGQSFEAAVIKPASQSMHVGSTGGPGTKDPGLYRCENCTVSSLVTTAWSVAWYQVAGADPQETRFDISARVPEGATKDDFRLMLQRLLSERFKLALHHEQQQMPVYNLIVAKNGAKLTPAAPPPTADSAPATGGPGKLQSDKNGFPILKGTGISMASTGDRAGSNWLNMTTAQLARQLSNQLGKPVNDLTGLAGTYDISLSWVPGDGPKAAPPADANGFTLASPAESLPDLFAAVQEQLGLKLEATKGMVDVIVIDHVEKLPTEN